MLNWLSNLLKKKKVDKRFDGVVYKEYKPVKVVGLFEGNVKEFIWNQNRWEYSTGDKIASSDLKWIKKNLKKFH